MVFPEYSLSLLQTLIIKNKIVLYYLLRIFVMLIRKMSLDLTTMGDNFAEMHAYMSFSDSPAKLTAQPL